MNVKYGTGRVPMATSRLTPGQYTIVLFEEGGKSKPMTQSFTVLR
jgi:hypothetical protein